MKKLILSFILPLSFVFQTTAQSVKERKKITPTRITEAPKVDGILTDAAWKNTAIAKNFIMFRPDNGKSEPDTHKTEVKIIYDDEAIYISAFMYDDNPSSIPLELTNRDNLGQSDFFLITINPNDDGQNSFEFVVTNTGTQADAKIANGREDFNWSAVWKSGVQITDKGWNAEIKIPYSALRFANRPVQSWGINFHRKIQSLNAQFTWNHIDNTKGNWTQYDGLIENLRDIKPPTRLSFYPYASLTSEAFDGKTSFDYSAGLDIKYGITENFTLDATLIPDFGQIAFDDVTLNLGPFEQEFTEQRQFFTEGTELFEKGNLFYSRRIGDRASISKTSVSNSLTANETLSSYPDKVQMLNAVKISGRTKGGLGIGVFNAFTEKTSATITDTSTQESYKKVVEPFTNYNVLVLDQQFNQNSSVTFINTNVTRDGSFRDGNVTGLLYNVSNKKDSYYIDGEIKMSHVGENDAKTTGYSFNTSIGKSSGNWQGEVGYAFEDNQFNINDLGFQFNNNQQSIYGNLSYRILKPTKKFNTIIINTWFLFDYLHKPSTYIGNNLGFHAYLVTKERFSLGGGMSANLGTQYDYYEPRQGVESGQFFIRPTKLSFNHWGSSDYRKQFAYDYRLYKSSYIDNPKNSYGFSFSPRYRLNKQFLFSYGFGFSKTENDQGYIDQLGTDIIFGQRDRKSYNNTISGKYNFSSKSSLSLTFRHNWEAVKYDGNYFNLGTDGLLNDIAYTDVDDINFNSWNFDLNYVWEFAPGSQLIAFYRNTITNFDTDANLAFFENIDNLFEQPIQHIFSLRFVYFIDYNNLKNTF